MPEGDVLPDHSACRRSFEEQETTIRQLEGENERLQEAENEAWRESERWKGQAVELRAENEALKAERDDQRRRLGPDSAGGFRWEAADLDARLTWLRNQMGDVRGMQSDGATPEEMDEALGRALSGERARLAFDEARAARSSDEQGHTKTSGNQGGTDGDH